MVAFQRGIPCDGLGMWACPASALQHTQALDPCRPTRFAAVARGMPMWACQAIATSTSRFVRETVRGMPVKISAVFMFEGIIDKCSLSCHEGQWQVLVSGHSSVKTAWYFHGTPLPGALTKRQLLYVLLKRVSWRIHLTHCLVRTTSAADKSQPSGARMALSTTAGLCYHKGQLHVHVSEHLWVRTAMCVWNMPLPEVPRKVTAP